MKAPKTPAKPITVHLGDASRVELPQWSRGMKRMVVTLEIRRDPSLPRDPRALVIKVE